MNLRYNRHMASGTVKPYPDDAPFVPIKLDEPIPSGQMTLRGKPRNSRRRGVRTKIRDPLFVKACFSLALREGMTTHQIARQLHTSPSTVQYILDAGDIEQQRRDSVKLLAKSLTEVTEMVLEDTLAKRDRRLGFDIMSGSGILEAARPQPKPPEEGGRITIEWNGPPPPWAPAAVQATYRAAQPTLAAKVAAFDLANHPTPQDAPIEGVSGASGAFDPSNVIDAEVCDDAKT